MVLRGERKIWGFRKQDYELERKKYKRNKHIKSERKSLCRKKGRNKQTHKERKKEKKQREKERN